MTVKKKHAPTERRTDVALMFRVDRQVADMFDAIAESMASDGFPSPSRTAVLRHVIADYYRKNIEKK